ncbi:GNAT family N-acetyltransferase [Massilia cellulosiltytica]|uniref:GNAT family N-acetyltransferase n=1 Tax=Massilia cellulosiltytica TaxID=2683234 RepID=UPI001E36EF84|nr:GNAT family N-acetyltransferase [Telluria cellulosilytica]
MPTLSPIELFTPRLKLRWMDERDVDAHYAVFADPEVARYWSSGPWTSLDQSREHIAATQAAYADGSGMRLGVELIDTGELIGNVSLHRFVDTSRRCEMGYALARAHWGGGYVSEALRALLAYGFTTLDLNRIEADVDPRNGGVRAGAGKAGLSKGRLYARALDRAGRARRYGVLRPAAPALERVIR